jgi:hypothetical protein
MIVVPGDKNDWQRAPRNRKPAAQLDAGSITQINIKDDAESLVQFPTAPKRLGRPKQSRRRLRT